MGMIKDLIGSMKKKAEEVKERREFLDMVEREAKPKRRAAYMKQMMKEVVLEGMQKAHEDSEKRRVKKEKKAEDFGIRAGLEDPFKYINGSETTKSKETKK